MSIVIQPDYDQPVQIGQHSKTAQEWIALGDYAEETRKALRYMTRLADEAFSFVDADMDAKAMKLLRAMTGKAPGYRADVDEVHAVLNRETEIGTGNAEQMAAANCRTCVNLGPHMCERHAPKEGHAVVPKYEPTQNDWSDIDRAIVLRERMAFVEGVRLAQSTTSITGEWAPSEAERRYPMPLVLCKKCNFSMTRESFAGHECHSQVPKQEADRG